MRGPYLFVSGRWDNVVSVVDVAAALKAGPGGSPAAIVSRPRVTPDIDGGTGRAGTPASGQPVNLVIAADRRLAYVVNHSGRATPEAAAAFQHGHPGLIAVLDVAKALDPANSGTTNALVDLIETGTAGPVGLALTPDRKASRRVVGRGRGPRGRRPADHPHRPRRAAGRAAGRAGARRRRPREPAAAEPASGPARELRGFPQRQRRRRQPARGRRHPDRQRRHRRRLGHQPRPRAEGRAGRRGGARAGAGGAVRPRRQPGRAPLRRRQPRERPHRRRGQHGLASSTSPAPPPATTGAERARVRVGTDRADEATRPFAVAFTRDGDKVVATCFRSNTVSLVDVDKALAGAAGRGASRRLHRRRTAAPAARAASRCCRTASTRRSSAAPKARPAAASFGSST